MKLPDLCALVSAQCESLVLRSFVVALACLMICACVCKCMHVYMCFQGRSKEEDVAQQKKRRWQGSVAITGILQKMLLPDYHDAV